MAARFFGEYLLANGLISESTLAQVVQIQQSSNLKLGELAVVNQLISQQQADEINLRQQIENKRFGNIAEALGLLDHQQLEKLLSLQKQQHKYFGDVLIDLGLFSEQEIKSQLSAHQAEKKLAYQLMLNETKNHCLADYLSLTIDTNNRIFIRILHELSQFSQLVNRADKLANYEAICKVTLVTAPPISITYATNQKTAQIIASKFTFQPIDDCDLEFSIDAFGEFLNIVVGHLIDHSDMAKNIERTATQLNVNLSDLCQNANNILIAKIDTQIGGLLVVVND